MKKLITFLFVFAAMLAPLSGWCQPEAIPLDGDLPFFQKKASLFQRWLDNTGLGQVLKIDHVRIKPTDNTELELIMTMNTTGLDTAVSMWAQLKKGFDSPADSLEEYLYRMFEHTMEIPAEHGNIQIYVKDFRGEFTPCFYVWIWRKDGKLITQRNLDNCKSQLIKVPLKPIPIKNTNKGKNAKIAKAKVRTADETFAVILDYFDRQVIGHPKYKPGADCAGRAPFRERGMIRNETTLSFSIQNLCREILDDEDNSLGCKLLKRFFDVKCNDKARERITYTFEYLPENNNGATLKVTIDGKFGNGVFKPRTEGYMDMETDFPKKLESYANELYNTLYQLLNQ